MTGIAGTLNDNLRTIMAISRSIVVTITNISDKISMFHRAFFNSIIDKTPTHALFIQHYI